MRAGWGAGVEDQARQFITPGELGQPEWRAHHHRHYRHPPTTFRPKPALSHRNRHHHPSPVPGAMHFTETLMLAGTG